MDNNDRLNVFKLLGSPFKQRIIKELRKHSLFVSEITKILNVEQPTLSHHLADLEAAGIVQVQEQPWRGITNKHYYSLCPETLGTLVLEASKDIAPEAITQARKRRRRQTA